MVSIEEFRSSKISKSLAHLCIHNSLLGGRTRLSPGEELAIESAVGTYSEMLDEIIGSDRRTEFEGHCELETPESPRAYARMVDTGQLVHKQRHNDEEEDDRPGVFK